MSEREALEELGKMLFPDSKYQSFFHHQLYPILHRTIRKSKKYRDDGVGFSSYVVDRKEARGYIYLQPTTDTEVKYIGSEFSLALFHLYNHEFWLIRLWIRFYYDHCKHNSAPRVILTGFIRNCLKQTSNLLLDLGDIPITKEQISQAHKGECFFKFYKDIFYWPEIIKCMPIKGRKKLWRKYPSLRANFEFDTNSNTASDFDLFLSHTGMNGYIAIFNQSQDLETTQVCGLLSYLFRVTMGKKNIYNSLRPFLRSSSKS